MDLFQTQTGASDFTSPTNKTMTSSNPNSRPPSVDIPMNKIDIVWQRPDMTSSGDNKSKYLVEERRRTIIISTQLPPDQWDDSVRTQIYRELSSMGEEDPYDTSSCRRTHSWAESEVITGTENDKVGLQVAPRPMRSFSSSPFLSPKHAITPSPPASTRSSPFLSPNKLKKPPSPLYKNFPRKKIYFYNREDPYYGFTNFSSHSVKYEGKVYPTSEHLFQSFKFQGHRPLLAEHIRLFSDRPSVAFAEARRFSPEVRPDWKDKNVEMMDIALWHKFTQHPDLKQELLGTGDAELIEDSDKDAFWGIGADRRGRNELGKALERLRDKLRR